MNMRLLNPKAVIKGDSLAVGKLLTDQYEIPPYQRDFVWKRSHVEQLWQDLISHYRRNVGSEDQLDDSPEAYFLGAMVVLAAQDDSDRNEVVDGQQRMVSLTCIAAVLRDEVRKIRKMHDARAGLESQLSEIIASYTSKGWNPKLQFHEKNMDQFFVNTCTAESSIKRAHYWENDRYAVDLLGKRKSAVAKNIRDAFDVGATSLEEFLGELNEERREQRLTCFCHAFLELVIVLRITSNSHSTAYELFESLNARGVNLTQADLIKNELMATAGKASIRCKVIENWMMVREELGRTDYITVPDFLHYSFVGRYKSSDGTAPKAAQLFSEVKRIVRSGDTSAEGFSDQLVEDVSALDELLEPKSSKCTDPTLKRLKDLRYVLDTKFAYVALIPGWLNFGTEKKKFEELTALVVNFSFRFMKVLGGDAGQLATYMHKLAHMIREGKDISSLRVYLRRFAPDKTFKEAFETFMVPNAKLGYFVVYWLEATRLRGTMPVEHGDAQHLEHIMPKQPAKSRWPTVAKLKDEDPETFRRHLWMIGNLIPLPGEINSSIGNLGIDVKLDKRKAKGRGKKPTKDYSDCTLVSPKEVINFVVKGKGWGYESIRRRQRELASKYAVEAWPI